MLTKLVIQDYALVDRVDIDFRPGLTVLTGETGAGKSVIIGGLLLALGGPADKELIRHGAAKSTAVAIFSADGLAISSSSKKKPDEADKKQIQFSREVHAGGSSRGYINGAPENLTIIRDRAARQADFHSQQGHRKLLDMDQHRAFLDSFAGLSPQVEALSAAYQQFTQLERQLADARQNASAMAEKLELINFQREELTKASIRIGEEADLDAERKRLESVRYLMETGQATLAALMQNDDSVLSALSKMNKELRKASGIDTRLASDSEMLDATVQTLGELNRNLESYLSRLEDNPTRLDEINTRLAELYRLRKKYGTDEAGLTAKLEEFSRESYGAEDIETLLKNLSEQSLKARETYLAQAMTISGVRQKQAARFEKQIERQLADLAMDKVRFKIDIQQELDEQGFAVDGEKLKAFPHGLENIEFLISTNPNEPLRPLTKIASGGEISRIMLAILSVIAGKYDLPTIIFDEIDTGIGGQTAHVLADKLKALAGKHQVIVISHLPAVAAVADNHLAVSKSPTGGRNVITVREVRGAELRAELARLHGKK